MKSVWGVVLILAIAAPHLLQARSLLQGTGKFKGRDGSTINVSYATGDPYSGTVMKAALGYAGGLEGTATTTAMANAGGASATGSDAISGIFPHSFTGTNAASNPATNVAASYNRGGAITDSHTAATANTALSAGGERVAAQAEAAAGGMLGDGRVSSRGSAVDIQAGSASTETAILDVTARNKNPDGVVSTRQT